MISLDFFKLRSLSKSDERDFLAQHSQEIRQILPVLGPLFGAVVILFGIWDAQIDSMQAHNTLLVRIALVICGSLAYVQTGLPWTPVQRAGYIYCTHASAIIIAEYMLQDGFLYGLAGIAVCLFSVSAVTLRIRTFLLVLSIPSVLFVVLIADSLSLFTFINSLMLYIFSVLLAGVLMLVIRSFRQKAFLYEKELMRVARHDSLTGAYNRGYLIELAERELALSRRHGRQLSIALLDIDHFKSVNDTYGHAVGDEVIKALVNICKANLREIDHFGRIGGEEFVCVLPEADRSEAMACAERLRRSIENNRLETPKGIIQFTVSIGVAVLDISHANWGALLKDADGALYKAKNDGRNRVVLYENPQHRPHTPAPRPNPA